MAIPALNFQVTIPASGRACVADGLPVPTGDIGNLTAKFAIGNQYVQWLTFQNNSAHAIRYGGPSVSTTLPAAVNGGAAGNGILLGVQGDGLQSTPINYGTYLSDWFIAGTAGDVIDVLYIA